jgi:osmoprotectant transport system substrate-binding protein
MLNDFQRRWRTSREFYRRTRHSQDLLLLIFGALLLLIPIAVIIVWPARAGQAVFYLRSATALGAGLIGGAIPGFFELRQPGIRAGGGMAMFVLVFLINPATPVVESAPTRLPASSPGQELVIGAKDFLEASVLTEIAAQVIERETNIPVVRRHDIGESAKVFNALLNGEIDAYPEYSGTILAEHLRVHPQVMRMERMHNSEQINQQLAGNPRTQGVKLLDDYGFENPYVITMLRDRAESLGIVGPDGRATLSRLADATRRYDLNFKSTYTFSNRQDGLPGLVEHYNLEFAGPFGYVRHDRKPQALLAGEMDVTDFYGTDPELLTDSVWVTLDDDMNFFPLYRPALLVREEALQRFPGIEDALRRFSGRLQRREMAELLVQAKDSLGITVEDLGREVSGAPQRLYDLIDAYLDAELGGN